MYELEESCRNTCGAMLRDWIRKRVAETRLVTYSGEGICKPVHACFGDFAGQAHFLAHNLECLQDLPTR